MRETRALERHLWVINIKSVVSAAVVAAGTMEQIIIIMVPLKHL